MFIGLIGINIRSLGLDQRFVWHPNRRYVGEEVMIFITGFITFGMYFLIKREESRFSS